MRIFQLIDLLLIAVNLISAQLLPDSQAIINNELEHLYFDDTGPGGFKAVIEPCTNYVSSSTAQPDNTLGQQTAAQWIRTAFHDVITANVAAGTGGLDASIGFETFQPENVGVAFNDSLFFFSFFVNAKLSMADLIAMGAAMAVGACGGPHISLRGGRIDATEAGPSVLCEPETDIEATLAAFSGAGFNQEETIALTACGHAMGGRPSFDVSSSRLPSLCIFEATGADLKMQVTAEAIGPDNLDGRIAWDNTVANFDVNVVKEYLAGTGNRGGPLVTTANKTVQSDLRLYTSDNNATMEKLAQSPNQFALTCASLITRMIDVVTKGVELTPVLDPALLKHYNISLNIDWSGTMSLSGFFKYIEVTGSAPAPNSLTVSVISRDGQTSVATAKAETDLTRDQGTGIFGPTHLYPFTAEFTATGVSGLAVSDQKFPLQDSLFVVPALSSVSPGRASFNIVGPSQLWTFNITAALLTTNPPVSLKATYAIPVPQPGNMSPRIDYSNAAELALIGTVGPYALFSGIQEFNLTGKQLFRISVDVEDETGNTVAMFFKLFGLLA